MSHQIELTWITAFMELRIKLQSFIKIMTHNIDEPLPIVIDQANSF